MLPLTDLPALGSMMLLDKSLPNRKENMKSSERASFQGIDFGPCKSMSVTKHHYPRAHHKCKPTAPPWSCEIKTCAIWIPIKIQRHSLDV